MQRRFSACHSQILAIQILEVPITHAFLLTRLISLSMTPVKNSDLHQINREMVPFRCQSVNSTDQNPILRRFIADVSWLGGAGDY